jgi:hypothetical protein
MGERAHNYLHAFDGRSLNWSAALGMGFASAPKRLVSVFREASRDELLRIAREGLTATPPEVRHPEVRHEMELLDQHRPEQLVKRGVSRLGAIFAVPTAETPRLPFRKEYFVLEMKIEPKEAYVGDMDFVNCLIPFMGGSVAGLDRFRGAFVKYWDSVIPFSAFRKHYRRVETGDGSHWLAARSAPKTLPRSFVAPEVLVMSPVVDQRHLRIVRHETAGADRFYEEEQADEAAF